MQRFYRRVWTAGFCLAFFLSGCGQPVYRLDGQVPKSVRQVVLLDSSATGVLDSLQQDYERQWQLMVEWKRAALDSLEQGAEALSGPIGSARRAYEQAEEKYDQAFERLRRFRSFGGNPIFSSDDRNVNTQTLLAEIADRFYKGRAFSLETEREVRHFIRRDLQPLEQQVVRAKGRLAHLRRSKSNRIEDLARIEQTFQTRTEKLLDQTNTGILAALEARQILSAQVDTAGYYLFEQLRPATYHVFAPYPLPQGFLVPVTLAGHTRQDLGAANARRLQVQAPEEG